MLAAPDPDAAGGVVESPVCAWCLKGSGIPYAADIFNFADPDRRFSPAGGITPDACTPPGECCQSLSNASTNAACRCFYTKIDREQGVPLAALSVRAYARRTSTGALPPASWPRMPLFVALSAISGFAVVWRCRLSICALPRTLCLHAVAICSRGKPGRTALPRAVVSLVPVAGNCALLVKPASNAAA